MKKENLAERIADRLNTMITIEEKFLPGDRIPNEYELAKELDVSRTTIREAIKILVSKQILEIKRGRGTYVLSKKEPKGEFDSLLDSNVSIKDLYEIRLIFEPKAAYFATERANDLEIKHILEVGRIIETKIQENQDRTEEEFTFHRLIAKATHNEFMNQLLPIIHQGIGKGVLLSANHPKALESTLQDHRMLMEFLELRNPEGAGQAMKIHILHAMIHLGMQ